MVNVNVPRLVVTLYDLFSAAVRVALGVSVSASEVPSAAALIGLEQRNVF